MTIDTTGREEWGDAKVLEARFGIARSLGYELTASGKIRSVSLKRDGMTKAKRLYDLASVRAYLTGLASPAK